MGIVNIGEENLHIFRVSWGISMKFSEKMRLMKMLKITKNQGLNFSLYHTLLEKPQMVWGLIKVEEKFY